MLTSVRSNWQQSQAISVNSKIKINLMMIQNNQYFIIVLIQLWFAASNDAFYYIYCYSHSCVNKLWWSAPLISKLTHKQWAICIYFETDIYFEMVSLQSIFVVYFAHFAFILLNFNWNELNRIHSFVITFWIWVSVGLHWIWKSPVSI